MNDEEQAIRRAHAALGRALDTAIEADDHPEPGVLEAFVDGRLDEVEAEIVDAHAAACPTCAEDIGDLRATRDALAPPSRQTNRTIPTPLIIGAGMAAALLLAIWGGRQYSLLAPQEPAPSTGRASGTAAPAASPLTVDEQAIVTRVLAAGRLELPDELAPLRPREGVLRGTPSATPAFGPASPVGTLVASTRPQFTWQPQPGATGYTVAVFDEQFAEVARGQVRGTSWAASRDLARGSTFLWQVTAHLPAGDVTAPAPPAPEARFRVLDAATAATVSSQEQRLAARPLELGVLLARAGLIDDARRVLSGAPAPGPTLATGLR